MDTHPLGEYHSCIYLGDNLIRQTSSGASFFFKCSSRKDGFTRARSTSDQKASTNGFVVSHQVADRNVICSCHSRSFHGIRSVMTSPGPRGGCHSAVGGSIEIGPYSYRPSCSSP